MKEIDDYTNRGVGEEVSQHQVAQQTLEEGNDEAVGTMLWELASSHKVTYLVYKQTPDI